MATGVNGYEKLGPSAATASKPHRDPHPLPTDEEEAVLQYPGKLSVQQITAPVHSSYVRYSPTGDAQPIDTIVPNAVILADNFYALHSLLSTGRRATLIYLDPPFGTGMEFQSRQLQHAYVDKLGEAAYLEFMRRRIVLMRELLTEDGSIYLHIGHQMVAHLKVIMDEVFGQRNFRNIIARRKCSSKNFTSKQYANMNDYILFYSRSSKYKWNQPGEKPDDEWIEKEYPKKDARGRYKLVPVHAPGTRRGETGKPWRGMDPPPGKHWQYVPTKLDELDARGEIHWSKNGNPRRKVYLEKDKLVGISDYWAKYRDAHHQSIRITGYPTEKNLSMLKLITCASSDTGDLVVDPFCGSGTTLHAAMETGRNWIGIDESFTAIRATLKRLRHGPEAMGDYVATKTVRERDIEMLFQPVPEPDQALSSDAWQAPDFEYLVDAELRADSREELQALART